ncbi:uncharacterized protein LOC141717768 [Apium graveolens]|uniref:uncharacterized protein LOC141717768 n=1 Tax=Apium graveolens TaxID=4045 RepID=UPI003D7B512F
MAKGMRGRRRIASRQSRTTPYPVSTFKRDVSECSIEKKCSDGIQHKKDWEDATCSVCMEYPHNAVLLLCSSYDKGCRAYMCGTSCRYSNCLDQYEKAYRKGTSSHQSQVLHGASEDSSSLVSPPVSSWPIEKCGEVAELACPLCRGQVKGWTVLESAREYLNGKKRTCMEDKCSYVGTYKELKSHVKLKHPTARPWEVDPALEQKWKRLEREREREDVISTITSSMPGSVVFGDYVIERNPDGFDTSDEDFDDDDEGFNLSGLGNNIEGLDRELMDVFLLFQELRSGRNVGSFGRLRRLGEHDADGYSDDHENSDGTSLVNSLQGRNLSSRSGRRRRRRRRRRVTNVGRT